jgi:hypothetical protein
MSRFEKSNSTHGLAYGIDHACGLFVMVWKIPEDEHDRKGLEQFGPDSDDIVVDKDTLFSNLTIEELIDISRQYNLGLTEEELGRLRPTDFL